MIILVKHEKSFISTRPEILTDLSVGETSQNQCLERVQIKTSLNMRLVDAMSLNNAKTKTKKMG